MKGGVNYPMSRIVVQKAYRPTDIVLGKEGLIVELDESQNGEWFENQCNSWITPKQDACSYVKEMDRLKALNELMAAFPKLRAITAIKITDGGIVKKLIHIKHTAKQKKMQIAYFEGEQKETETVLTAEYKTPKKGNYLVVPDLVFEKQEPTTYEILTEIKNRVIFVYLYMSHFPVDAKTHKVEIKPFDIPSSWFS